MPDQLGQLLRPIRRCPPVALSKVGIATDQVLQFGECSIDVGLCEHCLDKGDSERADVLAAWKVNLLRVVRHRHTLQNQKGRRSLDGPSFRTKAKATRAA